METSSDVEPTTEYRFKSGLTWRSYLSLLYAFAVFTPAIIYLSLVTVGVEATGAIGVCSLLIFAEFARLSGKSLTKQEATIILAITAQAGMLGWESMIYREYYATSPIAAQFGVTQHIPYWWVPPPSSGVWDLRTFLHPAWTIPAGVFIASGFIAIFTGCFFGILNREFYIEEERLPFPMEQITGAAVLTLTERREESLAILTGASIISMVWATLLYVVPMVSATTGYPVSVMPVPWVDYTTGTYGIERFLPGGSLGIATDMMLIGLGIMLPFKIVISMFLGSITVFMIGNPILIHFGLSAWANPDMGWTPGMDMRMIWQKGTLYFWACPIIGMGLGAGIAPLILHRKIIIRAFKSLFARAVASAGPRYSGEAFSRNSVIFLFILGPVASVILNYVLLSAVEPVSITFLIAILIFQTALPLILSLIINRIKGITGQVFMPPHLREVTIIFSGYTGYGGWFLPMQMYSGQLFLGGFKISQLTETTAHSWAKAFCFAWPVGMMLNFLFVSTFWSLAPIPSNLYPAPAITWPVQATFETIWITRPIGIFSPEQILYYFVGSLALGLSFEYFNLPISIISAVIGASSPPPGYLTMLIGALIGKVFARIKGEGWFNKYKATIGAGISVGEGIAIVIGVALVLIIGSRWVAAW